MIRFRLEDLVDCTGAELLRGDLGREAIGVSTDTRTLEEGIFEVEFPIEYSLEAREAEWEHEKRAVTASLMPILYPTSVAVIGASRMWAERLSGRAGNLY